MTKYVTDETFEQAVINSKVPVMVDFTATWCGPCQRISPIVDKLSGDFASDTVQILKADIDDAHKTANNLKIRGVPTFVFYKEGKEIERWVGSNKSEEDFRKMIQSLID